MNSDYMVSVSTLKERVLTHTNSALPTCDEKAGLKSFGLDKKGKSMKFRPLHDRVLVRRVEADAKTAGGIIIPDSAQEKPSEGKVVAVGSGLKDDDGKVTPLDVKKGDKILFGKWSGTEVTVDGEELIIMKESDILGIIEK
jgi:chaperonin GroES